MSTKRTTPAKTWAIARMNEIAAKHFAARVPELEYVVGRLVKRHEEVWRSQPVGAYRPTIAMYALALRWELDKRGPKCSVCDRAVDLPPRGPTPPSPAGPHLSLAPRLHPFEGGLNVPQNLALCHAGCMPGL
jgi:hypothetical protein